MGPAVIWPNRMGWNVGEEHHEQWGEVWKLAGGAWGVRTFKGGEAYKHLRVVPSEHLFMTPEDAVALCFAEGEEIE